jgi:hypothetical protein
MKKLLVLFLFIALSYSAYAIDCETCAGNLPGSGTPDDPYRIEDIADLLEVMGLGDHPECTSCYWDSYIILMADLDFNYAEENSALPIGTSSEPFSGNFDGNGKTISNLNYQYSGEGYIGFFGKIGNCGYVHNLKLKNIILQQDNPENQVTNGNGLDYYFGGIAGWNEGKIHSCYVDGTVSGFIAVGGAVGANFGEIIGTHAVCNVYGLAFLGGFVGSNGYEIPLPDEEPFNKSGPRCEVQKLIKNCSAKGNVNIVDIGIYEGKDIQPLRNIGGGYCYGGFVGAHTTENPEDVYENLQSWGGCTSDPEYTISECFATGNVTGYFAVGGFAGAHICQHIEDCYSIGDANGYSIIGGFVGGAATESSIDYCYSYGAASSSSSQYEGGFVGLNYGNGYECCFWNNTANSGLDAVGYNTTTPNPPDGIDGLTEAAFTDFSNFSCFNENRPDGVWVMGDSGPILYGTTLPTLTEWAVIIFIGLLAGIGGWFVWRRMV